MKIIYQTATGIAIIHPTGELSVEEVAAKDVPAGAAYQIIEDDAIPSDRTFRNAWKADLTVDMTKAVAITKDRLRAERAPLLEAQDTLFQRAQESGASTSDIVSEKTRLRDVTNLADVAGITLEQMKALKA